MFEIFQLHVSGKNDAYAIGITEGQEEERSTVADEVARNLNENEVSVNGEDGPSMLLSFYSEKSMKGPKHDELQETVEGRVEHISSASNRKMNSEFSIVRESSQVKNPKQIHARGSKGKKRRRTWTLMIEHWYDKYTKKNRSAVKKHSEGETQGSSNMSARKKRWKQQLRAWKNFDEIKNSTQPPRTCDKVANHKRRIYRKSRITKSKDAVPNPCSNNPLNLEFEEPEVKLKVTVRLFGEGAPIQEVEGLDLVPWYLCNPIGGKV